MARVEAARTPKLPGASSASHEVRGRLRAQGLTRRLCDGSWRFLPQRHKYQESRAWISQLCPFSSTRFEVKWTCGCWAIASWAFLTPTQTPHLKWRR
jgi:hypothetical protein